MLTVLKKYRKFNFLINQYSQHLNKEKILKASSKGDAFLLNNLKSDFDYSSDSFSSFFSSSSGIPTSMSENIVF